MNRVEDNVLYTVSVSEGWNLLNGGVFVLGGITSQSIITKDDIMAIYYYSPIQRQYIRIHPNPDNEKIQREKGLYGIDQNQTTSAATWVYVKKEGMLQYETDDMLPTNARKLRQGWNFVSVTADNLGKNLDDFKGSCKIESVYYYLNGYQYLGLDAKIGNDFASSGLLVKSANDCTLDEQFVAPPGFPEPSEEERNAKLETLN